MAEHAHLIRAITVRPSSGNEAALLDLLKQHAGRLAQVDGCFGAQVTRCRQEPGTLTLVVRWQSDEASLRYRQTDLFAQAREALSKLAEGEPRAQDFDSV